MTGTNASRNRALRRRHGRRRGGFTLAEILISMGVLVFGMGMIAGAFQAGIKSHKTTVEEFLRSMIAENAIAVIKARVDPNSLGDTPIMLDDTVLGPLDKKFPIGPDSSLGFLLYGCRGQNARSECEFIVFPYRLGGGNVNMSFGTVSNVAIVEEGDVCRVDPDTSSLGWGKKADTVLPIGSVIIERNPTTNQLSVAIVAASPEPTRSSVWLDRKINAGRRDLPVVTITGGVVGVEPLQVIQPPYHARTSLWAGE